MQKNLDQEELNGVSGGGTGDPDVDAFLASKYRRKISDAQDSLDYYQRVLNAQNNGLTEKEFGGHIPEIPGQAFLPQKWR